MQVQVMIQNSEKKGSFKGWLLKGTITLLQLNILA
jgi:hypothetical protein